MSLKKSIEHDMKQALKGGEKVKLSTLRLTLAAIKNAEIAKKNELEEMEIIEVIGREIRRREEAIGEYTKANRIDLAEKEQSEAEILRGYLPPQLTREEIKNIIAKAIEESGATSSKEMGKVMSLVMPQVKGKAEGRLVNELVKEALSEAD